MLKASRIDSLKKLSFFLMITSCLRIHKISFMNDYLIIIEDNKDACLPMKSYVNCLSQL